MNLNVDNRMEKEFSISVSFFILLIMATCSLFMDAFDWLHSLLLFNLAAYDILFQILKSKYVRRD
jgi:hypothetical protein